MHQKDGVKHLDVIYKEETMQYDKVLDNDDLLEIAINKELIKFIIINANNEIYNKQKDCFVKEFDTDCLCDKKTAMQFGGTTYKIYAVPNDIKKFSIIKKENN